MQQQQKTITLTPGQGGGLLARTDQSAAPMSADDVRALRIRQNDLKRELQDAAERRNSIAGRLREADIAARPGYEGRLKVIDERIITIETELTRVIQQLNAAPAAALVAAQPPEPQLSPEQMAANIVDDIVPIVAILSVFVLLPITIAISRFLWRRSGPAPQAVRSDHATQQRLEQLQQSVDTIAIEVERISEGQRFVNKVLGERQLGAGEAEPVRAARSAALPIDRG